MDTPKTLMETVRYFADPGVAETYMRNIKWPSGKITCPHCNSECIGEIATRNIMRCKECRKQFSSRVGTIFESSPLGLDKWFVAVWAIANCKNGISSHELARAIGVTQKSAWFMLHRVRKAMEVGGLDKFEGPCEADATFVGGLSANMHKAKRGRVIRGRGAVGKTPVHGILERTSDDKPSRVRATVVRGETDGGAMMLDIRRKVRIGATVYTDESRDYSGLCRSHVHAAVDHSREYVNGAIHTNGMENFWSLLKRSLGGTYVAVAPFHLNRYVSEQVFRFNERRMNDAGRFELAMRNVPGKRLTYRALTGAFFKD